MVATILVCITPYRRIILLWVWWHHQVLPLHLDQDHRDLSTQWCESRIDFSRGALNKLVALEVIMYRLWGALLCLFSFLDLILRGFLMCLPSFLIYFQVNVRFDLRRHFIDGVDQDDRLSYLAEPLVPKLLQKRRSSRLP